jgi:nitroreductase
MSQPLRHSDYPIQPQFLERWSPRAFADQPVSEAELLTLFEAARWSPSASNLQPWRFIYGLKGEPEFAALLSLLVPFNEGWAKDAAALVFLTSVTTFDGERPVPTGSFDAGAAWMSLALQAHAQGLVAHAMYGIDFEKAPLVLGLPETMKIEAAIAIGHRGDPQSLPEPLRAREIPSDRQPLDQMVFKGAFGGAFGA